MKDIIGALNQADKAFHRASQYIALAGICHLPPEEDNGHMTMSWNAERKRIEGRWIEGQAGEFRLTLDPIDCELKWENRNRITVDRHGISNTPEEQIRKWFNKSSWALCGADSRKAEWPYKLPNIPAYTDANFPEIDAEAITHWARLRSKANRVANSWKDHFRCKCPVIIWPKHFNTELSGTVDFDVQITFGLSMADLINNTPYFYLYAYKEGEYLTADTIPINEGQWIETPRKGFILPYEEVMDASVDDIVEILLKVGETF